MGKHGVGKSTAGNSLLGRRVFETQYSEKPVTQRCKSESRIWRGRKVLIIDTPDLSSAKDVEQDLLNHTFPGPHAFLLVTPLGSFNERDLMVLSTIRRIFGDNVTQYMIVLLTRKEDLGNQDLDTFLKIRAESLYKLIEECKDRRSIFNYSATGEQEQCQVDELLQKIVSVVQQHGGKPCTFRGKGKRCLENLFRILKNRYKCAGTLFSEGHRGGPKDRSLLLADSFSFLSQILLNVCTCACTVLTWSIIFS